LRGPVFERRALRLEAHPMTQEAMDTVSINIGSRGPGERGRRRVIVRVLDGPREVDSFQSSSGKTLRDAVRPVYRHLTRGRMRVQFTGVEEQTLPLGIRRTRREVPLSNFGDALMFLEA
jgi:hypothetical protein